MRESSDTGTVVHAGCLALYIRFADAVVGVVAREAVHVPIAVAVTLRRLPEVVVGSRAEIRHATLCVAGLAVSADRMTPVDTPRLGRAAAERLRARLPDLDVVRRQLPASALTALAEGDPAAVSALLGRGDGLTPVGDDVLAGWLVAGRAVARDLRPIRDALQALRHRTTDLSAALLLRAAEGETVPELRTLLLALASGSGVEDAVARLVAIGHTSGAGMLLGAELASAHACPDGSRR